VNTRTKAYWERDRDGDAHLYPNLLAIGLGRKTKGGWKAPPADFTSLTLLSCSLRRIFSRSESTYKGSSGSVASVTTALASEEHTLFELK
jgi:hypothetical protein